MTILKLSFAGQIKGEVKARQARDSSLIEFSVCKKVKIKDADDRFDWVRVTLWKPAEFQTEKLVSGAFVAGCGDFSTRSYVDKAGATKTSLEVRCSSYDVEVGGGEQGAQPARAPAPERAAPVVSDDAEIPF